MNSIVAGAIGTAVGALTTEFLHWPIRLWRLARTWVKPDHVAIHSGWTGTPSPSSDSQVRIRIAVAPSRSLKRISYSPPRAIEFINERFPGFFSAIPEFLDPSFGVRFQGGGSSPQDCYLWFWTSGKIDYQESISVDIGSNGIYRLELLDLVSPLLRVAEAVISPEYWATFQAAKFKRPRTFDWQISVSTGILDASGNSLSKVEIAFPGAIPKRAKANNQPSYPMGGYGGELLRSWNPKKGTDTVLQAFLWDFLQHNGYYDCDEALVNFRS